jgi:prepilin-type N-terminal cleavage/methylation domain-containing protein
VHGRIKAGGFTLIEVILTIIIVSIAVLTLVSSISFTTSRGLNAEVMSTAQQLAQEKVEELIAKKRDSGYSSSPDLDIGTTTVTLTGAFANYTRSVEVCNVDSALGNPDCTAPDNGSGFKRITVEVNYTPGLPNLLTDDLVQLITVVTNVRE